MGGLVSPVFLFIILFPFLLFPQHVSSADDSYVNSLISLAEEKGLFKEKYWKILLHYKDTLFGQKSLIDDPAFFLAKNGKNDPKAELEATLRAFFRNSGKGDPAVCRFIARFTWLKKQLNIDVSELPLGRCSAFDNVIGRIKPTSVALIFPAEYMNNPASMFGHTLINIESGVKSKLLAHTINYSAFTGETFGPLFAFKGVFGFYRGYYSMLPYYEKVREYSDISQRDMWEYELNLTEEEVRKMLMHLWELQNIYSQYYFFTENCSFNLLFLLDAARPSLDLTKSFRLSVIPIDTVKEIQEKGLVVNVDYRPSKSTKIRYIASQLNDIGQKLALLIAEEEMHPVEIIDSHMGLEEKIITLDLAIEYIQYRYVKKEIDRERYTSVFLKTLKARSKLRASSEKLYELPVPDQPEKGHGSNRLGLGFGFQDGDLFEEVRYRPAYHSLLDDDRGYDPGAQIQFGNFNLRYYSEDDRLVLERFDIIDIISLAHRDRFFKPYSWKFSTGFNRKYLYDGRDHPVARVNTGGGFSYYKDRVGLYYCMVETDLNVSSRLDDSFALGIGPSIGLKGKVNKTWLIHVGASSIYYPLGDTHWDLKVSLDQNFTINRNNSVVLECSWNKSFDHDYGEFVLMWNLYF
ncbi:MAG: DUF4105 domain-containing protein [Thermodesulfobacteriota bacterium]|nr:DUF4105 domain-containing protein [Thermodesulfobacteriota bacterium]